MDQWKTSKLGNVCELIKRGVAPKYVNEGGVCVINQKCIRDHSVNYNLARRHNTTIKKVPSERYVRVGDVLVNSTGTGTLGRVAQIRENPPESTTVDTHVTIVRPKEGLFYDDFFGYMLVKIEDEITSSGEGTSGQTELARTTLEQKFDVSYPVALPEQKRIVAILDETFAGISQAVANAEKNLANARELFESYLNAVFTRKGEGWVEKPFGKVCDFVRGPFGGSLKKSCFVDDGYAVYEQQHAIYNQFDQIRYFVNENKFNEMSRFELRSGDLIMSCSGTMGRVAIAPEGVKKGIINQALLKLSPCKNLMAEFLKYWMESISFQEQISLHSQGAAIKNVASVKVLKMIDVPVPSSSVQNRLVSKSNEYLRKTQHLESIYNQKLTALTELKQSILQKAFAGELTRGN